MFGALIVPILVGADTGHLGFIGWLYDFPYGDKVGHFLVFGCMSLLANLAVFEARSVGERSRLALKTSIVLAVFIGLEETAQRWFPTRTPSVWDFAASCLGVIFFAWIALRIDAHKRGLHRAR